MRILVLLFLGCLASFPAAAALYRSVDEAGNVTYSDRPQHPRQEALQLPPPNVATPEARRQLEIARRALEREEQAEYEARFRRAVAVQRPVAATYPRSLTPYAPRYALPVYYVGYAQTQGQSNPSQGIRPAGVPHRAGNARR